MNIEKPVEQAIEEPSHVEEQKEEEEEGIYLQQ